MPLLVTVSGSHLTVRTTDGDAIRAAATKDAANPFASLNLAALLDQIDKLNKTEDVTAAIKLLARRLLALEIAVTTVASTERNTS
jgi:hypothetical protein